MKVRSWYGLPGEITIENELWHLVKVCGVPLVHPPVINRILRHNLPPDERLRLSFLHEFGHFQTAPIAVAHLVILLRQGRHRASSGTLTWLAAAVIAHHAGWELSSEVYVLKCDRSARVCSRTGLLFWLTMTGLSIGLSYWLMRS